MVYQLPAQTYFYQKDIIDHGGNPHQLVDITSINYSISTYIYHISTIYLPYTLIVFTSFLMTSTNIQ